MHDNFRINHIIFSLFQSTKPGLQELGANKEETDEVPDTPSFDGNQVQKHFNGWLCLVPSCFSIDDSRANEGEMKAGLKKMGASLGECWKCAILRRLTWKGRSTYGRTYRSAYRRFCPGASLQHVVWVASLSNRVIARKKFSLFILVPTFLAISRRPLDRQAIYTLMRCYAIEESVDCRSWKPS